MGSAFELDAKQAAVETNNLFENMSEVVKTAARFPTPYYGTPIPIAAELMTEAVRWIAPTHPTLLDPSTEARPLCIAQEHVLRTIPNRYLGTRATFHIDGDAIPGNIYVERGTKVDFLLRSSRTQYRVERVRGTHGGYVDIEIIAWLVNHTAFYDLSSLHWPPIVPLSLAEPTRGTNTNVRAYIRRE